MAPDTTSESTRVPGNGLLVALTRFGWLVAVPALLAAIAIRLLVPTTLEARGTWAQRLANVGDEHGLLLAVALFVAFAAVTHHFDDWLPATPTAARGTGRAQVPIILAVLGVLAIAGTRAFLVGTYTVLGASMMPTLEPGDLVAGSRIAYGARASHPSTPPQRGDIVVFAPPAGVDEQGLLVKRVIGLPGDTMTMRGPHPVINGWEVPSCDAGPYVYPSSSGPVAGRLAVEYLDDRTYLALYVPSAASWGETYVVKPGEVFVLGDNRTNSSDSRYWNEGKGGSLPFDAIDARVKWWLSGLDRDTRMDTTHFLKPLELDVRVDGIDTSLSHDAIWRCLQKRPASTHPPEHA